MIRTLKIRTIKEPKTVKAEILTNIKRDYKIDSFIYKGSKVEYKNAKPVVIKFWYIVEYQTGIAITGDTTKEASLKRFEEWLQQDKRNLKRLQDLINDKIKDWGVINND